MTNKEIDLKVIVESHKAAEYLENLAKSFRDGKIYIQKGKAFLILEPESVIEMEIEVNQKKDKEKLELKFSWYK
ncbi:MAG: amphi-Trp domain-containing protein [Candidatus Coatesbacteria bacterium]|nr:amphi-Trp domain-containing protein [Candidatus Coatesbacteria bacterium]